MKKIFITFILLFGANNLLAIDYKDVVLECQFMISELYDGKRLYTEPGIKEECFKRALNNFEDYVDYNFGVGEISLESTDKFMKFIKENQK